MTPKIAYKIYDKMENKYFQILDLKTLSTKSEQLRVFQQVQYQNINI